MGYRLRAALVVGFLLVSLSTWADITKLDCSFPRVSSSRHGPEEQEFKFTILIDDATETAIVVGRGRETAHYITGMDGRITVLETTMSGTVQVTAILRNGNAIHSRHTTVDGSTFVPSQAYGTCR